MKKSKASFTVGMEEKHLQENIFASSAPGNYLDVKALVRSLQRAEGRQDCFLTERMDCDETDCRWRSYCMEYLAIIHLKGC